MAGNLGLSVLGKIMDRGPTLFGHSRKEFTGRWKSVHKEKLRNLSNIIRLNISSRMG